jgi:hypothetical protein
MAGSVDVPADGGDIQPIQWDDYDAFDWAASSQAPMDSVRKASLTQCAEEILELRRADRLRIWGFASPPGRYASTVIRMGTDVSHRFTSEVAAAHLEEVGLKLYKTDRAVRSEATRLVQFHQRQIERLPGLPNPRVQKSVSAGHARNGLGQEQHYVVQQWMPGETFDQFVKRRRELVQSNGLNMASIIRQLFAEIIFPLWSAGTVWWDMRDANFCYSEHTDTVSLIDVDSLGAYADEILASHTQ